MRREFSEADIKRFWTHVTKAESCWLWTPTRASSFNKIRYGKFGWDSRNGTHASQISSHQASWIIHFGKIPRGLCVLHNCPSGDRKDCVNPKHLYLGTNVDNARDRAIKNQVARGDKHGSVTHPERLKRGSDHPQSKLTERKVRSIRSVYKGNGNPSLRDLSHRFGVSITTVVRILKGLAWKQLLTS